MRPDKTDPDQEPTDILIPPPPDVNDAEEPVPLDEEFALDHVEDPRDEEFAEQEDSPY
ncbi:MAG: hypothetical protein ABJC09_01350 [Terriglobia bacterium]